VASAPIACPAMPPTEYACGLAYAACYQITSDQLHRVEASISHAHYSPLWIRLSVTQFCLARLAVLAKRRTTNILHQRKHNILSLRKPAYRCKTNGQHSSQNVIDTIALFVLGHSNKHKTSEVIEANGFRPSANALGKRKYLSRSLPLALSLRHSTNT
ncbi:hypothetical protein JI435_408700, partial [Parastagonospora nodorum SN15]